MNTVIVKVSSNKLKPLKGNTYRVSKDVSPASINRLIELGATVIVVAPEDNLKAILAAKAEAAAKVGY